MDLLVNDDLLWLAQHKGIIRFSHNNSTRSISMTVDARSWERPYSGSVSVTKTFPVEHAREMLSARLSEAVDQLKASLGEPINKLGQRRGRS